LTTGKLNKKSPVNKLIKFIYRALKWWRRPESNRCPNIFAESFLHVYSILLCREPTGNRQPINSL